MKIVTGASLKTTFADEQSLIILCDSVSDNCGSEGFVSENGVTFGTSASLGRKLGRKAQLLIGKAFMAITPEFGECS
jgi:hypothetical protein